MCRVKSKSAWVVGTSHWRKASRSCCAGGPGPLMISPLLAPSPVLHLRRGPISVFVCLNLGRHRDCLTRLRLNLARLRATLDDVDQNWPEFGQLRHSPTELSPSSANFGTVFGRLLDTKALLWPEFDPKHARNMFRGLFFPRLLWSQGKWPRRGPREVGQALRGVPRPFSGALVFTCVGPLDHCLTGSRCSRTC